MTDRSVRDTLVKYGPPKVIAVIDNAGDTLSPSDSTMTELGVTGVDLGESAFKFDEKILSEIRAPVCGEDQIIRREMEQLLDFVAAPRSWVEDGKLYKQVISQFKGGRKDVLSLQKGLSDRMKSKQARKFGLCPIRRDLLSQVFTEVIRQVTLNCPERGMVLIRVREESAMTFQNYLDIITRCMAWTDFKERETEEKLAELSAKSQSLDEELAIQHSRVHEMLKQVELTERSLQEAREDRIQQHADNLQTLKRSWQLLKQHLEGIRSYDPENENRDGNDAMEPNFS